ncbi:MAG: hypothetical protein MR619_02300 [Eubacterium sp.]|nr:hypothetical protein [Eubacterium sp.]
MDFFSNSFSGKSSSQPVYSDADAYSGRNQILETPSYLDTFKSENYKNASAEERMYAFQALEHDMAQKQGRKERQIVFKEMEPDLCGYYTDEDDCIYLNSAYISDEGAMNNLQYDGMDTVIHEGRHATQADCINGYCDPPDDKLSRNMEGIRNCNVPGVYTEGKKTGNYRLLPNEYDAFNYANDVMSGDMSKHFNDDPAYNDYVASQRKSNEEAVNDAYNSRAAQYLLQEDRSNYNDALNNINTVAQFQTLEEAYQNPQYYQNAQQRLDDATNTLREHSNPETLGNEYANETAEKYRSMGADVLPPSDAQRETQNRPDGAKVEPINEEPKLESDNQNKESNEIEKNEGENEEKPSEESESKLEEPQGNQIPENADSPENSMQKSENPENAQSTENSEENGAKPEQEESAKENSQTNESIEQSDKETEQDKSEENAQNDFREQENGAKPEEPQENQIPENADGPENSVQKSENPENAESAENSEENGAKPEQKEQEQESPESEQNGEKPAKENGGEAPTKDSSAENGAKPNQDNSFENGTKTENSQGANDSSNAAQPLSDEQSGNHDQDKDQGEENSPPPAQSEDNETSPSGPSNDNSMDMGE